MGKLSATEIGFEVRCAELVQVVSLERALALAGIPIPASRFPLPDLHAFHNSNTDRFPIPDSRFPTNARLLAIDWGERRIGLAVSDPTGTIASPAGHIVRRAGKRPPIAALIARASELEAEGFVFGLPLDDEGDDTPRATEVRRIAVEIEKRTGLPTRLVDERYTTAAALRAVRALGGSTRDRRGDVDALAATVLLQHALDVR